MIGHAFNSLMKKAREICDGGKIFLFEKFHGVDFEASVNIEMLTSNNSESLKHATFYQAIPCDALRSIFNEIRNLNRSFVSFVDVGSGKGKACISASKTGLFNEIIGIDISERLIGISIQNAKLLNISGITFRCEDAALFKLPKNPCVVYMYNPFDEEILSMFIDNNIEHFKTYNSIIIYAYDIHDYELYGRGFAKFYQHEYIKMSFFNYVGPR
jgi:SAM-dependent methyltransferase